MIWRKLWGLALWEWGPLNHCKSSTVDCHRKVCDRELHEVERRPGMLRVLRWRPSQTFGQLALCFDVNHCLVLLSLN